MGNKKLIKIGKEIKETKLEGYKQVLRDIQLLLDKAKAGAYKAVDNIRVQTYWQIGERIVREELQHKERADYGKRLIESLARDLGFGKVNLHYMVKFYNACPTIQTVSEQLSWSHYHENQRFSGCQKSLIFKHVELIYLSKQEKGFYENQSIINRWGARELKRQKNSALFERITLSEDEKGVLELVEKGKLNVSNFENLGDSL